jgi:hypothetical protein
VARRLPIFLAFVVGAYMWAGGAGMAGGATAPTTTPTTPTTTSALPTAADTWLLKALGTEAQLGSVRIRGSVTHGKTSISLSLVVNGDGDGGGTFVESGSTIHLERVGPLLYFDAPKKFWASHGGTQEAARYGGHWIGVSALDARFTSFDQFLNAEDLVTAAFEGHPTPLTVSAPRTFEGHRVVIVGDTFFTNGQVTVARLDVSTGSKALVYELVDDTPTGDATIVFSHYGQPVSVTAPPKPINVAS